MTGGTTVSTAGEPGYSDDERLSVLESEGPVSAVWRGAAAATLAALVTYVAVRYGFPAYQSPAQAILLVGVAIGLAADGAVAILIACTAAAVSAIVAPPLFELQTGAASGIAIYALFLLASCALIAGVVLWLKRQSRLLGTVVLVLGLVVACANVAVTANLYNRYIPANPFPPMYEFLTRAPQHLGYSTDSETFLRVYYDVKGGAGYYKSFRDAMRGDAGWRQDPPGGPLGYRMPTVFWLWAALPGGPRAIPWTLMLAQFLALGVFAWGLSAYVDEAFTLVGIIVLANYFTFFASTEYMLWAEAWAVPLSVAAVGAFLASLEGDRTGWSWISAFLALLAMLTREHFLILGVAGLLATTRVTRLRERRRWIPWIVVLAAWAAAWGVHAVSAMSASAGQAAGGQPGLHHWLQGGPDYFLAAIRFGSHFLDSGVVIPLLLAALGVAGILSAPSGARYLLAATALQGAAVLMVFGNQTPSVTGERIAYWGVMLTPFLLAAIPFAVRSIRPQLTTARSTSCPAP